MKYPNMTWGTMEAIVNKLGGEEGAKSFLRGTVEITIKSIIDWLGTAKTTATTEKFVAKDKFKLMKDGGICSLFGGNFNSWFLAGDSKIEEPLGEQELRFGKLTKNSLDGPIIEEQGGETKVETTLTEMFDQMLKQSKGEEGNLLVNGWWNIFYIRDINGVLRAVYVDWLDDGWDVDADSLEDPGVWRTDYLVFSRNS